MQIACACPGDRTDGEQVRSVNFRRPRANIREGTHSMPYNFGSDSK